MKVTKLLLLTFVILIGKLVFSQEAHLFLKNIGTDSISFGINNTAPYESYFNAFEIKDLTYEVYALSVYKNGKEVYKNLVYLRLGDSTYINYKNQHFDYLETPDTSTVYEKVSVKTLSKIKPLVGQEKPEPIAENEPKSTANTSKESTKETADNPKPAGWNSYPTVNKDLGAEDFVQPTAVEPDTTEKICESELDDKDIKKLKSKIKIFESYSDQIRILQEDLAFTCLYIRHLKDMMKFFPSDVAKLELIFALKEKILDPENRDNLKSEFLFETSAEEFNEIKLGKP